MTRPEPGAQARGALLRAHRDAHERRRLVLAIPDLAARLTRPPLPYSRPENWSGYLPPYMAVGRNGWIRNDSPQRIHLVAIVREAYARTCGEQVARAWLEEINTNTWTDGWSPHDALARAATVLDRHTPDWAKETR